jgi:hypothetical protein
MRSKDIISIIAFITAFGFSAAFASLFIDESQTASFKNYESRSLRTSNCRVSDKTCTDIIALLVQDIRNGEQRRTRFDYSLGDNANVSVRRARTVAGYSQASSSMEDSHLPSDFRAAWREHMKAWRDYSEFLTEVSRTKIDESEFERLEERYIYDINRTWATVLKIGRSYGASSPYIY